MADDDEEKPPSLRIVSDNPNAQTDRETRSAKEDARRSFSRFAAALLRTMVGSDSEASNLIRYLSQFIESQRKLDAVAGRGSTIAELEEALKMPRADMDDPSDDWGERRWMRERGYELIVQGALRLAAHKLLNEPPHFGGKYSERVIERGIGLLEELKRPNARPAPARQKGSSPDVTEIDLSPYPSAGSAPQTSRGSLSGKRGRRSFGAGELKELKKAIRAKDQKRIAELTQKIGKPPSES
jgi:hypothetical protein